MNVIYARNEHQGLSIVCPHCKFSALHDADNIGDAIKKSKQITCVMCGKRFTLAVFAVTEENVEQPLASNVCRGCGANLKYTTAFENGKPVCDACDTPVDG